MSFVIPRRNSHAQMLAPEPVALPAASPSRKTVAAIVTCHNYGPWLAQCLDSLLAQSHRLASIVVVDDSSTDDTWRICQLYAGRVKSIRVQYGDVVKARNAALAWLRGNFVADFVLPVDADNFLPVDYVANLLTGFTSAKIGAVYGVRWPHCENGRPLNDTPPAVVEYNKAALRVRNYADGCALIRWDALEQVGGWVGEKPLPEDWVLWLRMTGAGWDLKGVQAPFAYRMHDKQKHRQGDPIRRRVRALEEGAKIAVVTLFGGRKLHEPFDVLTRIEWTGELHHVALDNSNDPQFTHGLLSLLAGANRPFTYVRCNRTALPDATSGEMSNSADLRRRHEADFQKHMTRLYVMARQAVPIGADFVLTLEDDVEPPPDGLSQLMRVLAQDAECGMVAASVPSRFAKSTGEKPALIAWHGDSLASKKRYAEYDESKDPLATTFGFTLWRRPVFDGIAFRPYWDWSRKTPAFDFSAGQDVRDAGWRIKLAPVHCKHEG